MKRNRHPAVTRSQGVCLKQLHRQPEGQLPVQIQLARYLSLIQFTQNVIFARIASAPEGLGDFDGNIVFAQADIAAHMRVQISKMNPLPKTIVPVGNHGQRTPRSQ